MLLRPLCLAVVSALALASNADASVIFNLAGSVGAAPTFSIASSGMTATFASPVGNGFVVQNTTGLLSFSTALLDNNFFGSDNLTISFSSPVTNTVLIPFAILDAFGFGPDSLTVKANTGQSMTFGTTPDGLPQNEFEGLISFAPTAGVTSLTLSSPIAFAVGNVQVPEPMTLALFGVGLVGLVAARRRARPSLVS